MNARRTLTTIKWLAAAGAVVGAVGWSSGSFAAPAAKVPAQKVRAVVKGSAASDVRFVGDLRRRAKKTTQWCGHLEVGVTQLDSGALHAEEIFDSGRECGTIRNESVVMLTLACPRAIGVGGVLRGRPMLRARMAGGRTRSVPLKRIRDQRFGTFFSVAFTDDQLPAVIVNHAGSVLAEVPKSDEVC
jgi:hypothetical protein